MVMADWEKKRIEDPQRQQQEEQRLHDEQQRQQQEQQEELRLEDPQCQQQDEQQQQPEDMSTAMVLMRLIHYTPQYTQNLLPRLAECAAKKIMQRADPLVQFADIPRKLRSDRQQRQGPHQPPWAAKRAEQLQHEEQQLSETEHVHTHPYERAAIRQAKQQEHEAGQQGSKEKKRKTGKQLGDQHEQQMGLEIELGHFESDEHHHQQEIVQEHEQQFEAFLDGDWQQDEQQMEQQHQEHDQEREQLQQQFEVAQQEQRLQQMEQEEERNQLERKWREGNLKGQLSLARHWQASQFKFGFTKNIASTFCMPPSPAAPTSPMVSPAHSNKPSDRPPALPMLWRHPQQQHQPPVGNLL
ncbi:hypothetical protein DUNSADRAFT_15541 [Dunaliella salina]|uniref:Uncharacterized protein n=1 Tax=Dunaliella salina TaxID=3046 RepID=A0ABQ7G578_DUNSA|nr:hypothetical protein DUNSADRAFT_15541 [Dunaliella salina]|eukprot:KAF5829759.1 hypothetical protein DUNSADRAFT_15541 [Dunaliella salina]